jgi:hypothetical protein
LADSAAIVVVSLAVADSAVALVELEGGVACLAAIDIVVVASSDEAGVFH